MANVNVTFDELKSTGAKLRSGQSEVEAKLQQLKGLVDGLIGQGFATDRASGAFQTSYDEFNTGAKKAIEGLEGMAKFLDSSADAFQQADEQLASSLKG